MSRALPSIRPLAWCALALVAGPVWGIELQTDGFHVYPGDSIQAALDKAAGNPTEKVVKVHAGLYRPDSRRQALIWMNRSHDGIRLEAVGDVILSAANTDLSNPKDVSHPAVVNHIIYLGDGLTWKTIIQGFRLKDANGFVTKEIDPKMEPDATLPKGLFFYRDGGAIKVFGRSYPQIIGIDSTGNYSSPCAGGISVQHEGHGTNYVLIQDCIFRNNRAQVTGSAIDLLEGSSAKVVNCLFVGNQSNTGVDTISTGSGQPPFTNNGVVTVFQGSRVWMERCTFTGNRNGVDDMEGHSLFQNCIFWDNRLEGTSSAKSYDLDIQTGSRVSGCLVSGALLNPYNGQFQQNIITNPPPPEFDELFFPRQKNYAEAGYRPVIRAPSSPAHKELNPVVR